MNIRLKITVNDTIYRAYPLHFCAKYGFHDFAKDLLKSGANPELRDSRGCTAFQAACQYGSLPIMQLLFDAKVNLYATDKNGNNALHLAAIAG